MSLFVGTTAETPEFVEEFLETLNTKIQPLAKEDLNYLLHIKKQEDPSTNELKPWDVSYLTGKLKSEFLQVSKLALPSTY